MIIQQNEGSQDRHSKKNVVLSTLSLFFQSGYSAMLGLLANLIITITLSPKIFGIYITTLSIISLLNYFSDIGLAASLIQKKELTKDDLATTFTVQQLLAVIIVIVGYLASAFIKDFYKLPNDGLYLYWALLVGFFFSSFKTIPSIFLERKIQFQKIVIVQIVENTVFYVSVIIFALMGWGLTSFTVAVLLRSIIGVILIFYLSWWMPKIGINIKALKKLLNFGVPFQMSSFLALFKDDLITLYLGKVLGFTALGYIGWAKKWAEAAIRIIMDNISRVLFPLFSRIQNEKLQVARLVEKILFYQTLLLTPVMIGACVLMSIFVEIIPKYSKWQPALPLFYILSIAAFLSSYSTPFTNVFNALGKVKISFGFMVFWTVATWILTPIFSKLFGYYGFPLVQLLLSLAFVAVVAKAKQLIPFSFFKPTYKGIISGIIMGLVIFTIKSVLPQQIISLFILGGIGAFTYLILIRYVFKVDIIMEIKKLFIYD